MQIKIPMVSKSTSRKKLTQKDWVLSEVKSKLKPSKITIEKATFGGFDVVGISLPDKYSRPKLTIYDDGQVIFTAVVNRSARNGSSSDESEAPVRASDNVTLAKAESLKEIPAFIKKMVSLHERSLKSNMRSLSKSTHNNNTGMVAEASPVKSAVADTYYRAPKELINRENGKLRDADIPIGLEKAIFEKFKASLAKVPELKVVPKSFWVSVGSSTMTVRFTVKSNRTELPVAVVVKTSPNFKKIEIVRAELGRDNYPRGMKSELSGASSVFVAVLKKAAELIASNASAPAGSAATGGLSLEKRLANLDKREAEEIKQIQAKYKVMRANIKKGIPARGPRPVLVK